MDTANDFVLFFNWISILSGMFFVALLLLRVQDTAANDNLTLHIMSFSCLQGFIFYVKRRIMYLFI